VRQQQHDLALFVEALRDFSRRQAQLFLAVNGVIARYEPPELQPIVDDDVVDAAAALAATLETAARGVIYEHRPPTLSAERLATAIREMLAEAGRGGGSAFERDAAVVLRRVEQTARAARAAAAGDARGYFKFLDRVLKKREDVPPDGEEAATSPAPRLILP
jgi:hypothetical protein